MIGILLSAVGSACKELSDSIGKRQVSTHVTSYYTIGFLNLFFATAFLIILGILRNDFVFSLESLPTFLPRLFLEILQAHLTVIAVVRADRSDYGLVRTGTLPLLLLADLVLGYAISPWQIAGIGMIVAAVAALLYAESFKTKALPYLYIMTVNAAVTLSLYKYDIVHFNSVESEQSLISLAVMFYFFVLAVWLHGENPLRYLYRPTFLLQSFSSGAASAFTSFAYLFAPASIITSALRAFAVIFSILSGRIYFRERRIWFKLFLFLAVIVGLILIAR